jgi:hypothetical protein
MEKNEPGENVKTEAEEQGGPEEKKEETEKKEQGEGEKGQAEDQQEKPDKEQEEGRQKQPEKGQEEDQQKEPEEAEGEDQQKVPEKGQEEKNEKSKERKEAIRKARLTAVQQKKESGATAYVLGAAVVVLLAAVALWLVMDSGWEGNFTQFVKDVSATQLREQVLKSKFGGEKSVEWQVKVSELATSEEFGETKTIGIRVYQKLLAREGRLNVTAELPAADLKDVKPGDIVVLKGKLTGFPTKSDLEQIQLPFLLKECSIEIVERAESPGGE